VLEGVDTIWQPLGMSVESFQPRDVKFSTCPPGLRREFFPRGIYPLVIAVEYDIQGQQMSLVLDTYRDNPDRYRRRIV
jgi:hypothetical protein